MAGHEHCPRKQVSMGQNGSMTNDKTNCSSQGSTKTASSAPTRSYGAEMDIFSAQKPYGVDPFKWHVFGQISLLLKRTNYILIYQNEPCSEDVTSVSNCDLHATRIFKVCKQMVSIPSAISACLTWLVFRDLPEQLFQKRNMMFSQFQQHWRYELVGFVAVLSSQANGRGRSRLGSIFGGMAHCRGRRLDACWVFIVFTYESREKYLEAIL